MTMKIFRTAQHTPGSMHFPLSTPTLHTPSRTSPRRLARWYYPTRAGECLFAPTAPPIKASGQAGGLHTVPEYGDTQTPRPTNKKGIHRRCRKQRKVAIARWGCCRWCCRDRVGVVQAALEVNAPSGGWRDSRDTKLRQNTSHCCLLHASTRASNGSSGFSVFFPLAYFYK